MKRILRLALTLLVLIFFGLAAARLDWTGALRALGEAQPLWLAVATVINFVFTLLQSFRWRYLLEPAGLVSSRTLFRYMLSCRAASNIFPARAGEFLRVYLLRTRHGLPTVTVTSTLFIERFLDALGLAVVATPLLFLAGSPPWVRQGVLILVGGGLCGIALTTYLAYRGRRGQDTFLDRLALAASALKNLRAVVMLSGLTLLCWGAEILMVLCCLAAVRLPAQLHAGILVLLAVNLGLILQVTPGNVGPFEATALIALAALQVTGPKALAFALLYHLIVAVPITLAGLEGIRLVGRARKDQGAE